jgi:hypothetical protein
VLSSWESSYNATASATFQYHAHRQASRARSVDDRRAWLVDEDEEQMVLMLLLLLLTAVMSGL